jgi:hypothetical protein
VRTPLSQFISGLGVLKNAEIAFGTQYENPFCILKILHSQKQLSLHSVRLAEYNRIKWTRNRDMSVQEMIQEA